MPTPGVRPKRIGVVGSRRRNSPSDFVLLWDAFFRRYVPGDTIVSGGCKTGADRWAEEIARELGCRYAVYPPDFTLGVPACYFARNTLVARDCDELIAVVAVDRRGGTEDTVRKCARMGKRVYLLTTDPASVACVPVVRARTHGFNTSAERHLRESPLRSRDDPL